MNLTRLEVPNLSPGDYGPWRIVDHADASPTGEDVEAYECGYATGPQWEPAFKVLKSDAYDHSSTSRFHREAGAVHLLSARGTVVLCGLNTGMLLHNIAKKEEVEAVMVVESDTHLMEMVQDNAASHDWPGMEKVRFILGDPQHLRMRDLSPITASPMFLCVDYFAPGNWKVAQEHARKIASELNPRMVSFCGQELALMEWAKKRGDDLQRMDLDKFDIWCLELDMVMQHRSMDYLRYALVVQLNQTAYRQARRQQRVRKGSKADG